MFDAQKFIDDYNLPYETEGGNTSKDFISISCPFCDDTGYHLGIHKTKGYSNCWRCGFHSLYSLFKKTIKSENPSDILHKYTKKILKREKKHREIKENPQKIKIPGCKLAENHKKYLINRGFNPDYIERKYKITGTNHLGEYKFRIIIPIIYQGKIVSYQGRDITNRQDIRYKACKKENEIIHHKHVLYNFDNCKSSYIVVCEGVLDCWKLGDSSCSCFGVEYTQQQLQLLSSFDRVFILFDNDDAGQNKAEVLGGLLDGIGKEAINLKLNTVKDAGELSVLEAKNLMEELK